MGKFRAWIIFIKERFHPAMYVPTVGLFTVFNVIYAAQGSVFIPPWIFSGLMFAPVLFFFFRLRLFDEIKDYETDLKINPHRPLARGLLSVSEVQQSILSLTVAEFAMIYAITRSWLAVGVYAAPVAYSFLMYKEFFIGNFLRPHLTTYAVLHTFVSGILALALSAIANIRLFHSSGVDIVLNPGFILVALMNWFYFNYFEFARKTFAPSEERPNVPSYSNIFGGKGAVVLSLSQVVLGAAAWTMARQFWGLGLPLVTLVSLAIMIFVSLPYAFGPTEKNARFFRNASGAMLLIQYLILIFEIGMTL